MPKQPINLEPTREPGQYSLDLPTYFARILPPWGQPSWAEAAFWRNFVKTQPVAQDAKEFLISNLVSMDWMIVAKEDSQRDELKSEIKYYTDLFNHLGNMDYVRYVEWVAGDILDLPFGGASEVGRQGDRPSGRVLWVLPLDGATLFPTLNEDFPVGQRLADAPYQDVYFPYWAIDRAYYSPRQEIRREGYGMAVPEKIYLAMVALGRGDAYYANLLLDTPEAGILDLGDMAKESALQWVDSFRSMLAGIDPLKIPVLYEHNNEVKYIPFGRPPTDLMFDSITAKYASIICAGYGISTGDIGLSNAGESGGNTLAGSIRDERKTRRTGLGRLKKKLKAHLDFLLPPTLEMKYIDYDDERSLTIGRARMANATAFGQMIGNKYITPQEARLQMIADGMITIAIPEEIPPDVVDVVPAGNPPTRDRQIGFNQSPSLGGHGDVVAQRAQYLNDMQEKDQLQTLLQSSFDSMVKRASDTDLQKLVKIAIKYVYPQVTIVNKSLSVEEKTVWKSWYGDVIYDQAEEVPELVQQALTAVDDNLDKELNSEGDWWKPDLKEEAIIAIYLMAYRSAIEQSAHQMAYQLFMQGLVSSPDLNQPFDVKNNPNVRQQVGLLTQALISNLILGSKYFIRRSILATVKDALTEQDIQDRLDQGIDIETIIEDNVFVDKIVQKVRTEMLSLLKERSLIDADFEIGNIENLAITESYRRAGLNLKHWVCYGPDPCELCIENQSNGYVPMDFVFKSVYGDGIHGPRAHTHCHCGLEYNDEDLRQAFEDGDFQIWYGE